LHSVTPLAQEISARIDSRFADVDAPRDRAPNTTKNADASYELEDGQEPATAAIASTIGAAAASATVLVVFRGRWIAVASVEFIGRAAICVADCVVWH